MTIENTLYVFSIVWETTVCLLYRSFSFYQGFFIRREMRTDAVVKKRKKSFFVILNIFCPIIIGTIIYYIFYPDIIFVQFIDKLFSLGFHLTIKDSDFFVYKITRYYLFDFLWAYSLMFALYALISNKTAGFFKTFTVAFSFSTFMELLQLIPQVKGTFDFVDIFAEMGAELFAVLILIKFNLKEDENEKKN